MLEGPRKGGHPLRSLTVSQLSNFFNSDICISCILGNAIKMSIKLHEVAQGPFLPSMHQSSHSPTNEEPTFNHGWLSTQFCSLLFPGYILHASVTGMLGKLLTDRLTFM